MRARIRDCLSFALYKYVLKILRLVALVYNLVHYLPREQSPLLIKNRALPQFIDDSQVYLTEGEADSQSIREIELDELTGETTVLRWSTGAGTMTKLKLSDESEAMQRTVSTLTKTSDGVTPSTGQEPKRIHPKHFVVMNKVWKIRRWNRVENKWNIEGTNKDSGGGSGLSNDLERLAITLEWASKLNKDEFKTVKENRDSSPNLEMVGEEEGSRRNWAQCGLALGECLSKLHGSAGGLTDMWNQGKRGSNQMSEEHVRDIMSRVQKQYMEHLLNYEMTDTPAGTMMGDLDWDTFRKSNQERNTKIMQDAKQLREVARSLKPWKMDPENDCIATILVLASFGIGWFFGIEWINLNGEHAQELTHRLGMPRWTSEWLWTWVMFGLIILIFVVISLLPVILQTRSKQQGIRGDPFWSPPFLPSPSRPLSFCNSLFYSASSLANPTLIHIVS